MPKLWSETIEAHRQSVHDATLDAVASLVGEHGLLGLTMSQVAEKIGIGRATLYKYFPDIRSILIAWHERQVAGHLQELRRTAAQPGDPLRRLAAILESYARIAATAHSHGELAIFLHRDENLDGARTELRGILRDVLAEGAGAGLVRGDVAPDELAGFCLHAIAAAGSRQSKAAVRRLVDVIVSGLAARRQSARSGRT